MRLELVVGILVLTRFGEERATSVSIRSYAFPSKPDSPLDSSAISSAALLPFAICYLLHFCSSLQKLPQESNQKLTSNQESAVCPVN